MSDCKTMNLTPYHVEEQPDGDGFCLVFFCNTGADKKIKVRLHFRFWWTTYIARCLWQAIKYRRNEVASAEANMARSE